MCHLTKQLNCKHTVHLTNLIDASCCHGDVGMLHIVMPWWVAACHCYLTAVINNRIASLQHPSLLAIYL